MGAAATATAASPGRATLAGSASPTVSATSGTAAPKAQKLSLQVWLKPDITGATQFADAVSTPGSASYHQYLSPAAYTARFGATTAEAGAVQAWLISQKFKSVTVSAQRDYVSAQGTVATIDAAFATQMRRYRQTSAAGKSATVESNGGSLSVPSSLAADVLSITGLNSTKPMTEHTKPIAATAAASADCSQYWAQNVKMLPTPVAGYSESPLAVCGYSADQLRAAYGATGANTGVGQTVALIEIGQPVEMFQTLTDYAAHNGLPAPTSSQFRQEVIGQGGACGNEFDVEEQLDSEATYAMAPGADQLMVEGDSCNQGLEGIQPLFDADNAVLTGNGSSSSASIVSNSWEFGGENYPSIYISTANAIDLRASAEGVGMYFSSGDGPGVEMPASDPYSTAVGGTTLGLDASDNRLFETGWSDNYWVKFGKGGFQNQGIEGGAGGGTSLLWPEPAYQQGVVPSSMSTTIAGAVDRAVPDISADADPFSGMLIGTIELNKKGVPGKYTQFDIGGTSEASPLVAGLVADAQQGQATSFGFINPLLYSAAGTSAYHDALPLTSSTPVLDQTAFAGPKLAGLPVFVQLDSQGPAYDTYTDQVTEPGYDTMTGLGTPNGSAFIDALRSGS
jgi:subtilase family serine protease